MKIGEILELQIQELGPAGQGKAFHQDWQILVPYALPGQTVRVRILKRRQKQAEARVLDVLQSRPDQIAPACPHFGQPPTEAGTGCGGCSWQTVDYGQQLFWKQHILQNMLGPLLDPEFSIPPILPSPRIWGYRNKFELSFGDRLYLSEARYRALRQAQQPLPRVHGLGFHLPGSFGTLVDIQRCELMSPALQALYQAVREILPALGGDVYNSRFHTGYWRHLVLREGVRTGELMLHFNTTSEYQPDWQILCAHLSHQRFAGARLRSIIHSEYTGDAQIVGYQPIQVLQGDGLITEQLCGLRFEISPYAFFQTNTEAAECLYEVIRHMAASKQARVIYDLYCGTGTIGMVLALQAEYVLGIEAIESAVQDARRNAMRNGIQNCHFKVGKVEDVLSEVNYPADLVVVDPPRAGLHPKALHALRQLSAPAVIYVSCNPVSLARDLPQLLDIYQVEQLQPVDLFPQTGHIETVVCLGLR